MSLPDEYVGFLDQYARTKGYDSRSAVVRDEWGNSSGRLGGVTYLVREPTPLDAADVGAVHVRAWQEAYRGGLMPDEYLDSLSIDDRAEMWQRFLASDPRPQHRRFVADDHAGTVVGFILVGPGADDTAPEGEVYAISVDPHHWGGGAGTLLLDAGTRALTEDGFTRAVLWVHPGNRRARRFYEARGWSADDAERTQEVLGVTVPEARYVRPLP